MSNNINRYRIAPPSASRNPNNQFYQRDRQPPQEQQPGGTTGAFDESSFQSPETRVPQRGVGVDIFGDAPVGANAYLVAEWEKTAVAAGESVRVRAVLNKGVDGVVRVQVIHDCDGHQTWVESVNGFLNKGVVTAVWVTKKNIRDWNRGDYFFTIIGGKANATSSNRLKLK
ncbi:MAG: hypothetical protein JSS81_16810 [Acidobacteria bacterium]|nr:hypothetical protein [Acidobacteriota bacterium]